MRATVRFTGYGVAISCSATALGGCLSDVDPADAGPPDASTRDAAAEAAAGDGAAGDGAQADASDAAMRDANATHAGADADAGDDPGDGAAADGGDAEVVGDPEAGDCTGHPAGTPCRPATCAEGACDDQGECVTTLPCPIFVDGARGTDEPGCGTSWQAACASLQYGSDLARDAVPANPRVFVRGGTAYTAPEGESVLRMAPDLAYYGGFTDDAQQRPASRSLDPADYSVLDGQSPSPGEGRPVVICASGTRLDGFEVTGGVTASAGAGMACDDVADLHLAHVRFSSNETRVEAISEPALGGAIRVVGEGAFIAEHARFENNLAYAVQDGPAMGGAVLLEGAFDAAFEDCLFTGNAANSGERAFGGALAMSGGESLMVTDTDFVGNSARGWDVAQGGAVYDDGLAQARYHDVRFEDNYAWATVYEASGGAVHGEAANSAFTRVHFEGNRAGDTRTPDVAQGGALSADGYAWLTLTDVSFIDNWTRASSNDSGHARGGGLYAEANGGDAELVAERATFVHNVSDDVSEGVPTAGGGAFIRGGRASLLGASFRDNRVRGLGGQSESAGGGLVADDVELDVRDSDFVDNVAALGLDDAPGRGGGLFHSGSGNLTLTNVGFAGNAARSSANYGGPALGGGVYVEGAASVAVRFASLVENVPDSLHAASPSATVNLVAVGMDHGTTGAASLQSDSVCQLGSEDFERDPEGRVYLTATGAARCTADDAVADTIFGGVNWRTLTTRLDGTLDVTPVDVGRHYAP